MAPNAAAVLRTWRGGVEAAGVRRQRGDVEAVGMPRWHGGIEGGGGSGAVAVGVELAAVIEGGHTAGQTRVRNLGVRKPVLLLHSFKFGVPNICPC